MNRISTHITLAVSTLFAIMPAALAHDEAAHDDAHTTMRAEHQQVHDLANQGIISPEEHQQLDAQLKADHRFFHQNTSGNGYQNYISPQGYYGNGSSGYYPQNYDGNSSNGYYPQSYSSGSYSGYAPQNYYSSSSGGYPWNQHRSQHQALKSAHRDVHELIREGVISPQEHAAIDAQLKGEHAQLHSGYNQNNFGNQGQPRMNGWFN